ncbi:cyclic phosphodiesterase-like [Iris pallida]|uniref:Cyclic phosphodiesterase-like n=1 Tax=Iris pallida TaxID=29817 RepID=A0AAX6HSV6_IRIPA|nr:cyclic phosphodiesterase-like [Iris pallida]
MEMDQEKPSGQTEEVYSVWALPPDDVGSRLKEIMSALRSEFDGPAFDPHITLVGAVRLTRESAIRRLRSASGSLRPYTARAAAVSRGGFFYQCVYLLIEPTPEVMEAGAHCCGHFGYETSTPYMPHLSLLYGDLTEEEKEKARKRVEELDKEIRSLTFEVSSIGLFRTDTQDKTLKSWEMVEVVNLK